MNIRNSDTINKLKDSELLEKTVFRLIPQRGFLPVCGVMLLQFAAYYIPKIVDNHNYRTIDTTLDRYIPYVPFFVVFYVLAFLQWCVYYMILAREEKNVMRRYLIAGAISKTVCMIMFLVMPTTIARPEPGPGFFNSLCGIVYHFDKPTNLFPSMHCLESWLCMRLALEEYRKGRVPELSRSIVHGYTGEMIRCINAKQWRESGASFTAVRRAELDTFLEKVLSRRRWTASERLESALDAAADLAENMGEFFVRDHTAGTAVLSILVFLSTVLIKQHYVADVISAIILAELTLLIGKAITGKAQ